ncbi:unnamed protein product [Gordionus sp. m RMFG-2023]|uniref:uncharacterized protein LOC135926455 n=1 Tax=Gordionus sp. m RMFG-2023 TaxID=3053472 RepID=UPI0030E376F2
MDKAIFNMKNEFHICLKSSFPNLKVMKLNRVQWCKIRKLLGKPRRCSQAFFDEEKNALQIKRDKMRVIWQLDYDKTTDINSIPMINNFLGQSQLVPSSSSLLTDFFLARDLPPTVPHPLIIGSRVVARVRHPCEGMYRGRITAIDHSLWLYRVEFDRPYLGTQSVPDFEIAGWKEDGQIQVLDVRSVLVNAVMARSSSIVGGGVCITNNSFHHNSALGSYLNPDDSYNMDNNKGNAFNTFTRFVNYNTIKSPPASWLVLSPRKTGTGASHIQNKALLSPTFKRGLKGQTHETRSENGDDFFSDIDKETYNNNFLSNNFSECTSTLLSLDGWPNIVLHNIAQERAEMTGAPLISNNTSQLSTATRLETIVRIAACYKMLMFKAKYLDSLRKMNREAEKTQHISSPTHSYPDDFKLRYAELIVKIKLRDKALKDLCDRICLYQQGAKVESDSTGGEKVPRMIVNSRIGGNHFAEAFKVIRNIITANSLNYPCLADVALKHFDKVDNEKGSRFPPISEADNNNTCTNGEEDSTIKILNLIARYTSLLIQLKDSPGQQYPLTSLGFDESGKESSLLSFPLETLMKSVSGIRDNQIETANISFFQDNVEIHINHLKNMIINSRSKSTIEDSEHI